MTNEQKAKMAMGRASKKAVLGKRHMNLTVLSEEEIKVRAKHVPDSQVELFTGIWRGSKSKADRIKAKCLDCCCYQRDEVRQCGRRFCPLWAIRPFRGKE